MGEMLTQNPTPAETVVPTKAWWKDPTLVVSVLTFAFFFLPLVQDLTSAGPIHARDVVGAIAGALMATLRALAPEVITKLQLFDRKAPKP